MYLTLFIRCLNPSDKSVKPQSSRYFCNIANCSIIIRLITTALKNKNSRNHVLTAIPAVFCNLCDYAYSNVRGDVTHLVSAYSDALADAAPHTCVIYLQTFFYQTGLLISNIITADILPPQYLLLIIIIYTSENVKIKFIYQ